MIRKSAAVMFVVFTGYMGYSLMKDLNIQNHKHEEEFSLRHFTNDHRPTPCNDYSVYLYGMGYGKKDIAEQLHLCRMQQGKNDVRNHTR